MVTIISKYVCGWVGGWGGVGWGVEDFNFYVFPDEKNIRGVNMQ